MAAIVATGEPARELQALLAVLVLDEPSRLLMKALERAVIRGPGTIIGEVSDVEVTVFGDINLGRPFGAGILDEPIVVPGIASRRVGLGHLLGEELVHVEFEGLILCRNKPFDDGVSRCVDGHAVVVPVRHSAKS